MSYFSGEASVAKEDQAAALTREAHLRSQLEAQAASAAASAERKARLQAEVRSHAAAIAADAQREARGAAEQQRLAATVSQLERELRSSTEDLALERAARQVH